MKLQDLLDSPPLVHDYGGKFHSWPLPPEAQHYMDQQVRENSRTLETGAGTSTVLFAMRGAAHICISPDQAEIDRIRAYCGERGISLAKVDFRIDRSDTVLARAVLDPSGPQRIEPLDLALIDGCHGFPTPFLDWYYISQRLKVGGTLIVDDTQLWTGRILRDFLMQEPEWRLHEACQPCLGKTAIFVKEAEYTPWKEWNAQPYVERNSADRAAAVSDVAKPGRLRQSLRLLGRGRVRRAFRTAMHGETAAKG